MAITTVLFDLDGTLLPMNQEAFSMEYMKGLSTFSFSLGYDGKQFAKSVFEGIEKMVRNDGFETNAKVFLSVLEKHFGEKIVEDISTFDKYYETDFQKVKKTCGFDINANVAIKQTKSLGLKTILATNPLFPSIATESRIRWAGLDKEDFEIYTTYENSRYCKPNLEYYREIMSKTNTSPENCLMVGNDVEEDMIASQLGMKVFLITPCLINRSGKDISLFPHGTLIDYIEYIKNINK